MSNIKVNLENTGLKKEDFKEVISGGNLADTFIQNKKDKER